MELGKKCLHFENKGCKTRKNLVGLEINQCPPRKQKDIFIASFQYLPNFNYQEIIISG